MVPWFDITPCPVHLAQAATALAAKKYPTATRQLRAAFRQLERYPAYDRQCWDLLAHTANELELSVLHPPSTTELDGMLHSGHPEQIMRALRIRLTRYRTEHSMHLLEDLAREIVEQDEDNPQATDRYLRHARRWLAIYAFRDTYAAGPLAVRRQQIMMSALPPGDAQILNSLQLLEDLQAVPPAELQSLCLQEIQRCAQAKPCPIVSVLALEERHQRFADPAQQPVIAARCLTLIARSLADPATHPQTAQYHHFDINPWLTILLDHKLEHEAQQQIARLITLARTTSRDKRDLAAYILTDCASYYSSTRPGYGYYTHGSAFHTPDISKVRQILAIQQQLAPRSFSTALVWGMLGEFYLNQHDVVTAEACYNQSIAILNHQFGCNVTAKLCAHDMPGDGKNNAIIWDIYGGGHVTEGYIKLLQRTGRARIADLIMPLLD